MVSLSTFETLPDEIILVACQYLRGADVLYALFNLNTRLNTTITGYCHYVNLMTVPYQQFNYVVIHVLPCIVIFDQDSICLNVSEDVTAISYPNIEELTINISVANVLPRLFKLIPNIRRLCINIEEYSGSSTSKQVFIDLLHVTNLINFQLHSRNWYWTLDEITDLLQKMPSLQNVELSFCTNDKRFLTEETLLIISPSSSIQIDYFIHYPYLTLNDDIEYFVTSQSNRPSTACLLNDTHDRLIIHTNPCHLHSIALPGSIAKQMSSRSKFTQVEDLYIYYVSSLLELSLSIVTFPSSMQSIVLRLPWLKKLSISGIIELSHLLSISPNLDKLNVNFNCLKALLENNSTHCMLQTGITRLCIMDWIDTKSDLMSTIVQRFGSLCHIAIAMTDPTLIVDSFILSIIPFWKIKPKFSLLVEGLLSEDVRTNLRQWIIDNSYLTEEDSFSIQYDEKQCKIWL
ncbi:unnamed protein product [Rotaria sp. Silwood1]|nr:unnamed protein product [Rotaria sp. Silwood1]